MKILLIGEYSNVHWTLAEGLRALGHEVCVVSNGDNWKNYRRDINLIRKSNGKIDTLSYLSRVWRVFRKLRGYDVVQLINPIFLDFRAGRIRKYYDYLRRHNKKVFLGAFGMDHYWVKTCLDCKTFRYSDFNIGDKQRTEEEYNKIFISEWLDGEKTPLNQYIAKDCDGIIGGLYEYYKCYQPVFPEKTTFIPFPIDNRTIEEKPARKTSYPVRFFIGIMKTRSAYKGTDVMLRALERVKADYPGKCEIVKVESVPFDEYQRLLSSSDCLLDQLYSYTPAMNGLLAMSKGLVLIGGGEEEQYEILGENELRPIINVIPDEEDVYLKLKQIVEHPEMLDRLSLDSVEYIRRHHDYLKVAQQYLSFWSSSHRQPESE